jgi:hypothetical protein
MTEYEGLMIDILKKICEKLDDIARVIEERD